MSDEEMELLPGISLQQAVPVKQTETGSVSVVSEEQTLRKISVEQKSELLVHLKKIIQSANEVHGIFQKVNTKVQNDTAASVDGISLLQVRNHCLVEYLESLASYGATRCRGGELKDPIDKLVTNRCIIEKIKPLEKQLQYQINKYAEIEKGNTQNYRANPDSMLQSGEQAQQAEGMVSATYQAPKVSSTLYPKAESDQKKEAKYARSIRARTKGDALMDEVAADITEDPLEAGRKANASRELREFMKRQKEIEEFEEEHFVRLQRSKKDKAMMKKIEQMQGSLEGILDYGHIQTDAQREARRSQSKKK
ncbi:hypothetical protein TVAG_091630 [Trichomonas vaginalis G3]|uniref:Uncharacterized protein n=1 Tax=Trichomonas vaginalis (strain ATCC PRA-98 / G3) TaxID=412133 RepID=A2FYQ1_TRIV3|nr:maturation of SSU-rRNA from tricistronic rRNA transcript (SSU-rRNA, 5.8S rRNA, LSU-rRNA) [Trichomonas vaginalis G3]EAX89973.1 hypothetical protein TVAG_091630 [Trichomonas vaginalis G3]KAI5547843.1 maturation of SSU-rRNA from tricistronic rRNA transcript (SSU-rRNA, 5.8S rRNA, LSU-rRNA) [Trichomonas vaginalis G3]|eukprot:XP_001302903.1 hypothetical protein [Trichomonas vaginalis G3]